MASLVSYRQPPVVDEKDKRKSKHQLHSLIKNYPQAKGLAIVIGISGPPGVHDDVQNISLTFKRDLGFAVWQHSDPLLEELACLLQVAAEFNYPISYKFIVFYYAGHGGSDDGHGYVIPAADDQCDETNNKLFIDEGIVSPFRPKNAPNLADRYRLFFFDCCLSESRKRGPNIPKKKEQMKLPAHGNCLVAYATFMTNEAAGDTGVGGIWTRYLYENLKLDLPITSILDITYNEVVEETQKELSLQGPQYVSCIGTVYLKDHKKTWKDLKTLGSGQSASISSTQQPTAAQLTEQLARQTITSKNISPILQKSPDRHDLLPLIRTVDWFEFSGKLGVQDRTSIHNDVRLSEYSKLEAALKKWEEAEPTDVTWKTVIDILDGKLAKQVIEFLQKTKNYDKYSAREDFIPFDRDLY